ncbi:hypothetical protein H4Q26_005833 [Puccinia striiformis f. sp. tritici PST-130]|nr:hypothetical protein H4Q26_005833 [Puccinia striiformis f. sp. tritici PST-130]
MGFASGGLKLYEESWPGCTTPVKPLSLRSLRHGDIICFQVANSDEYLTLVMQGRRQLYPDTEVFYDSFTTRVTVAIQPQFSCVLRDPNYANVLLSKSFTYDQMANRAGEILQVDPTKLRFYTRHGNFNPEPIDRNATLADMMERPFKDWTSHRIFFYKLSEMSTCQVESKRWMEITATGAHNSDEVADLSKKLFESGFKLTEESFIGLFFHLSLPKLATHPFADICRKIDERPGGASIVSNDDLLKIARAQLVHFRQHHKITLREDDKNPAGTSSIIGETSNSQSEELE